MNTNVFLWNRVQVYLVVPHQEAVSVLGRVRSPHRTMRRSGEKILIHKYISQTSWIKYKKS